MSGAWSETSAAGLGAAILALLRAAFFVAAFGIVKCKFKFEDWAGPFRLTHWMRMI